MYEFVILFANGQTLEGTTYHNLDEEFNRLDLGERGPGRGLDRLRFDYYAFDRPGVTIRAHIPVLQIACLSVMPATETGR